MQFDWSDQEQERITEVTRHVTEIITAKAEKRGFDVPFPQDELRTCKMLGLSIPTLYGGEGLGPLMAARLFEVFGKHCPDMGLVFAAGAHLYACAMPIADYGSDAQKRDILPAISCGDMLCANAITEDDAGSDVYSLQMRATKTASGYILNGDKCYVTNAKQADLFIAYAATKPEDGFLGLSAFLVPRDTPGVTIEEPFHKLGLRSVHGSRVRFDECHVSTDMLLGAEGEGGLIFSGSMEWERLGLIAAFLGLAERQIETAIKHARTRKQFGTAIGKNQSISHKIVDLKAQIESARLLLYRACWRVQNGIRADMDVAMAKLAVSEAAVACSLGALHTLGGAGYAGAEGVERGLRDALASTIASGTSEMQRDIVARALRL